MTFDDAAEAIVAVGRWLDAKGWAPATAGNYSARLDDGSFAVTVSGRHKGRLSLDDVMRVDASGASLDDVMRVDASGASLDGKRPSAETALHLQLYALFPSVGAVLHSHSPEAVGLSRAVTGDGYTFAGHEMLKALPGITTHEVAVTLPITPNSQDMDAVAAAIAPRLLEPGAPPAYLIRSHGLYGWGRDMDEAARVIEAVEWMTAAELAERRFRG